MSQLRDHLEDYLLMRRALGYKLTRVEKLLDQFVADLDARGASTISTAHAVTWVTSSPGSQGWWALRLSAVRGFAGYLHTLDERCEVPPSDMLGPRSSRPRVPYLYSEQDLQALLAATATLRFALNAADISDADRPVGRDRDADR
jgi:site-specific recombinase XerC